MSRPLMAKQMGLGDYTVIQYLFIYSPCRVWGLGDGVSHPTSLPYALGGPKTPQFWFFPVETPIPKHCWAQSSPECPRPVHLYMDGLTLFSPASFRRLGDQTDRSQKHKGSRSSPHRAAPWLHRAGLSKVRPLSRGHVLGQGGDVVSASCPGSCLHCERGRKTHTPDETL